MTEIWKPVLNWEDFYEVSNLANVRSLDRWREYTQLNGNSGRIIQVKRFFKGQPMRTYKHGPKRERVGIDFNAGEGQSGILAKRGKCQLARVVWEAFNGGIETGYWVTHKNHIWNDCKLENLLCLPINLVLNIRDLKTNRRV